MGQRVHDADVAWHFGGGNEAGERDVFFQFERAGVVLKFFAPFTIADQQKFDARMPAHDFRGHSKEIVMALEFEEARNFSDNNIVDGKAKLRAKVGIVCGGEEWRKVEPAENFCILLA